MTVLLVKAPDENGDLYAQPLEWHGEGVEPIVLVVTTPQALPWDRVTAFWPG